MTRTSQPPEHRARAAPANALATNVRTIADLEQEALLERSAAERIADRVVRLTGSGTFALLHVGWFGLWVLANVGLIPGVTAVDPYPFSFLTFVVSLEAIYLLDDDETINAFALPGGQVFITNALAGKLRTEGELAAVLAHEIGHVVARHGAEHLAKAQLTQGLAGAAVIAASDPDSLGSAQQTAAIAAAIGQLVNMRFGREDELESDRLGVKFAAQAGYDPRAMIGLMEVLAATGRGQARPPEFFSTHPNPERRIERIRASIGELYPQGVPAGLQK